MISTKGSSSKCHTSSKGAKFLSTSGVLKAKEIAFVRGFDGMGGNLVASAATLHQCMTRGIQPWRWWSGVQITLFLVVVVSLFCCVGHGRAS